ncbi:BMC domain-containing protein [Maridesulfovibrio salexigens]|uniref:Microcompartments protein n=1 Tax=Maridesulfovibrio salexigens (strain ATCC 14822 / DSM 2638 / NCIMB 8403 / VKM B-1763) TaxID=526222 RepID=C6BX53_MARSD|nr:microcompartments protein [Maridesulfovibrio salexigens DSM 2638]
MRYQGEEALGLIETLGMVPSIGGADQMLKTADVKLVGYENIGSTLVAVMVKGDVAAVKASVEAGAATAAEIGKLTAQNVMPRPIRGVGDIVSVHGVETTDTDYSGPRPRAMGLIETFGIVYVLEAADAMMKAADVELIGYENVASGYISVLVQGDVAACQAAVEAGVKAVENMEAEVYASLVIPTPHRDLEQITKIYAIDNLLP